MGVYNLVFGGRARSRTCRRNTFARPAVWQTDGPPTLAFLIEVGGDKMPAYKMTLALCALTKASHHQNAHLQNVCRLSSCRPNVCQPNVCRPNVCRPNVCWLNVCRPNVCWPNVCRPNVCWPNVCQPNVCRPTVILPIVCRQNGFLQMDVEHIFNTKTS